MAVGDSLEFNNHKQKRARGQLSCTPCRVGKLKCNRQRDPACDQCLKRGRESACQYVPTPVKNKQSSNVKGRIRQLETLVKDLMVKQNAHTDQLTPPNDGDEPREERTERTSTNVDANVEASLGKLNIGKEEIAYTGENHWQTILSSLSDIQKDLREEDVLEEHEEEASSESQDKGATPDHAESERQSSSFILGNTKSMTREELLEMVPDKRTTDRLLSLWFNSPDPFKLVIHAPTFQEEYKRFWQDKSVSTMWLGLLFAILCLAESFGLRNSVPSSPSADECLMQVEHYQSLAASAAVAAEYTKPKEYTIECLLLYMVSLRSGNAAMNAWIVMGVIVRLALRMGYHRDPGHYSKITAFQAEMRRRVWGMTNMIDVLMSFQLGLPSMVRTVASDTKPPENLLDRDFSKTMGFLPPGRGEDELTPSLYTRAKLRLMHVFAEAAELSHATIPPSFETTKRLAADLEKAKEDIPSALQMPDMSELVTDPAEQLMCRFNLDLLYSKCRIVLFRRYMLVPLAELSIQEQDRGIGAGREACIKSARRVLDHHHTIHNAIQPGGQLENMRWYMGTIAIHDFLLAAMVICLELSQQLERDKMLRISGGMNCPTRQAMLKALQQSYEIWTNDTSATALTIHTDGATGHKGGNMYDETGRASKAVAAMLARIKAQDTAPIESGAAEPAKSIFDENGHQYFRNIGITPEGARVMRDRGSAFHGVVTSHDWGSIPDDFQFGATQQTPQPTDYSASTDRQTTNSTQGYNDSNWLSPSAADFDVDMSDPMSLDWQAWDNEVFNVIDIGIDWSAQQDTEMLSSVSQSGPAPNASGMHFSIEDMESVDLGGNFFTPFIENEKTAAWNRNPR